MSMTTELKRFADNAGYAWRLAAKPGTHVYHGIKVPVDSTPELLAVRRPIYRGVHERAELDSLANMVRPDDIVLEVGAGCGIVTTFLATHLSDSRNMHVFEANGRMLNSIRAVAKANGVEPSITIAALAEQDGEIEFFVDDNFLSSSSVDRGGTARKVTVPAVSAQGLVDRIKPTLLVFDIEGAETLFAAVTLPSSVRAICCEVHPHIIGSAAVSDVVNSFLNQGFALEVDWCHERTLAFQRASLAKAA